MEEANKELKKKIESILFAAGKKIELVEIAKLCRMGHNIDSVEKILHELKKKHDSEESPLLLMQEGAAWKLTVRERYIHVVQDIVKQSELSKTIMETLAVVAHKAPVLQSEIIKIRTNKAYDHLKELENSGYITREKKGRTKLIKLSPKFFEYFDIPPEQLKERFQKIEELEKAVEIKEAEAREIKQETKEKKTEQQKKDEEAKDLSEKEKQELAKVIKEKEEKLPEVDLVDEKGEKTELKTYNSQIAEGTEFEEPKSNIEIIGDKLGNLDVVKMGLSDEEKSKLIKEAAALRKEAGLQEKGRLKGAEAKEESEEKEKKFEKKFDLVGGGEETPSEKEEEAEEKPPEEEKVEEAKPEEKEAAKELAEKKAEPERVTTKGIAKEAAEERKKHPPKIREGKKLFEKGVPKGIQEKIDERVAEIVFGKKEEKEKEETEKEKEPEKKEEKGEETPGKY